MKKPTGRKPMRKGAYFLKEVPYKDEWRVDLSARNPRDHKTRHNWRAAIEYAQEQNKIREADKSAGPRHTFDEAARGWIDRCRKNPDVGPDSFRQYAHLLEKYVLPHFGRRVFLDITSRDIEKWVYDQIEHAAHKSVRHRLAVLSMILDYGADEWSGVNPLKIKKVLVPGKPLKRAKIPDRSDLEAIREFIRRPRRFDRNVLKWSCTRVLVVLGASCGLRVGECAALRWDSIDRDTGEIEIREAIAPWAGVKGPKTEAGYRKVPTTPAVREILDEHAEIYKQTFGHHVGYVLRAKRWKSLRDNPEYMQPNYLDRYFHELMYDAELTEDGEKPKFTFHALRHWCASHWLKATGGDVHLVAKWLGHKHASMTLDTYGHCIDDPEARARFERMPDWLDPSIVIEGPANGPIAQPALPPPQPVPTTAVVEAEINGTTADVVSIPQARCPIHVPSIAPSWVAQYITRLADGQSANDAAIGVGKPIHVVGREFKRLKLPKPSALTHSDGSVCRGSGRRFWSRRRVEAPGCARRGSGGSRPGGR